MQNKVFYYAHALSKEQHLDRQFEAFRKLGADESDIITDKERGKITAKETMSRLGTKKTVFDQFTHSFLHFALNNDEPHE